MKRKRMLLALQLGAGLVCVGLGHHFVASLRDAYPADGLVFYLIAIGCFVLAWRNVRNDGNAVWAALLDVVRGAWREVTDVAQTVLDSMRQALPYISARSVVIAVLALNVIAALLSWLLPGLAWLPGFLWALAVLTLIWYLLPRSIHVPRLVSARPARVQTETIGAGGKPHPIGLVAAIGLLIAGQLVISNSSSISNATLPISTAIDEAFHLGLGDNAAQAIGGLLLLVLGIVVFAVATRRVNLGDYPLLTILDLGHAQRLAWPWIIAALAAIALWFLAMSSIVGGATGWGGVWPWLLALIIMGICWWQIDRARGTPLRIHLERYEALGLSIALAGILIVFIFRLNDIPASLWGDEGAYFSAARDMALGRAAPDFFGMGVYGLPLPSSLYQSAWLGLLGANVEVWRLASAFAAWLAALPMYFLVRSTLGRRTAWISLALYAATPYVLTYARMGYETAQGLVVTTSALALVWIAVRRNSGWYAFLAGCAAGLSFFTTASARLVILLVLGWLMWIWITRRATGSLIARQMAIVVLGLVAVAAPIVVYGMTRAPEQYASKQVESAFNTVFYARDFYPEEQLSEVATPVQVGEHELFYAPDVYAGLIGRGILRTTLSFQAGFLINENYLFSALADPFGLLYLLGLGWCLARFRRSGYALWPAWLMLGSWILSGLSAYPPRVALMLPVVPALVALSALGLVAGVDVLSRLFQRIDRTIWRYALAGCTVLLVLAGWYAYFIAMPQHYPPDLENAIFWEAQQLSRDSDVVLVQPDNTPDDFQPWGLREVKTDVRFHLLKKTALDGADWGGLCPGRCRVFFAAADRNTVLPYLVDAFGHQVTVEYPNAAGAAQAYSFAAR